MIHGAWCVRAAKTVTQHRRRSETQLETEVAADLCYLSKPCEVLADGQHAEECVEARVLAELFTTSVAYVVMAPEVKATRLMIEKWFVRVGLESNAISVVLHMDAERAVADLVASASSSQKYRFQVHRASPRQHRV